MEGLLIWDTQVELDELTIARERENDPTIWVGGGQRMMSAHFLFLHVAGGEAAAPLFAASLDRAVALVLRISRAPPPDRTGGGGGAAAAAAAGGGRPPLPGRRHASIRRLDTEYSPRAAPPGYTEPTLALLAHSELLLGLLQANYAVREIAAARCADEVQDFLARPSFYDCLDHNRVTRLAAANLKEAVRLVRGAEVSAAAARELQRGGRVPG